MIKLTYQNDLESALKMFSTNKINYLLLAYSFCLCLIYQTSASSANNDFGLLSANFLLQISEVKTPEVKLQNSDWYLNGTHRGNAKKWLDANKTKAGYQIIIGPPKCPNRVWRSWFKSSAEKEQKRIFAKAQKKALFGYPEQVIKYCSSTTFLVKNGSLTLNPLNERAVDRDTATVIIKDRLSGEAAAMRAIQENDFASRKTGGLLFNERLKQICEFSFEATDLMFQCKYFGNFQAKLDITNMRTGDFTISGQNDAFEFFIVNDVLTTAKSKYSHILEQGGGKACSYNCD